MSSSFFITKYILLLIISLNAAGFLVAQDYYEDGDPTLLYDEVDLQVTEIRRIMPPDGQGGPSAKNHWTRVKVQGLKGIMDTVTFQLQLDDVKYTSIVEWQGEDRKYVDFDGILPDVNDQSLQANVNGGGLLGSWEGRFQIRDFKARVAIIDGNLTRVTAGPILVRVSDGIQTCTDDKSPCYYSKSMLCVFPPDFERCKGLESDTTILKHCDDTITQIIPIEETPTLLLKSGYLHLKYGATNDTVEVIELDDNWEIIHAVQHFECSPDAPDNSECSLRVDVSGEEAVIFTVVFIDEEEFVHGSTGYPLEIFEVNSLHLTEDTFMVNWPATGEKNFDVYITTESKLFETNYKVNRHCVDADCEAYFVKIPQEKEEYFAVVNIQNTGIAKKIVNETLKTQSTIYSMSTTFGTSENTTTFLVNTTTLPPVAKLVKVAISETIATNHMMSGTVSKITDGYQFNCSDDLGFEENRNFLLIEYSDDTQRDIQRVGAAYVPFIGYHVQLAWVTDSIMRVAVTDNNTVTIGTESCTLQKSPCFFTAVTPHVETVSLCITVKNQAPIGNYVDLCEVLQPSSPPALTEDPILLLLDQSTLNLRYEEMYTKVEILVLDTDDEWISKGKGIDCEATALNTNGCSMDITGITEGKESINIIVMSVDEDGFATGFNSYPFEIFDVNTRYLTKDAFLIYWSASEKKSFEASIKLRSSFDNPVYKLNQECGGQEACEAFFVDLDDTVKEYIAVVQNGKNAIAESSFGEAPDQSSVSRITNTVEPEKVVTTFTFSETTKPAFVKMVEVTVEDEEVANQFPSGEISDIPGGYEFKCEEDLHSFDHERKFLFVSYTKEETPSNIANVSAAYVTFVEYNVQLDLFADDLVLREVVNDDKTVTIENEVCDESTSPCFITGFSFPSGYVPLCTKIKNQAPVGNDIDQCEDQKAVIPPALEDDPYFLLLQEKTKLTLRYDASYTEVQVLVLNSKGEWLSKDHGVECVPSAPDTNECSLDIDVIEEKSINIAVLSIDNNGSLTGSSVYPFEMLGVDAMNLTEDAVLTFWSTSEEKAFDVSIRPRSNLDDIMYTMNLTCGGQSGKPCEAYFVGMNGTAMDYVAFVQHSKNAISKSIPEGMARQAAVIQFTSPIDFANTSIWVINTLKHDFVKMVEVVVSDAAVTDVTCSGEIQSNNTFEYNSTCLRNFVRYGTERKFLFLAYAGEETPHAIYDVAPAYVTFVELDVQLNWMGNTSILRVVNNIEKEILINEVPCSKDDSPCYFPYFESQTTTVDVCTRMDNPVSPVRVSTQCQETAPDKTPELSITEIKLKEDTLYVTAPFLGNTSEVNLIIFNNNEVQDEVNCTLQENTCVATGLNLPNSTASLTVLVACTREGGILTEAASASVEYLKFTTKKLSVDSLLVQWATIDAEEYVAQLFTDPAKRQSLLARDMETVTKDILCNLDNACYATFSQLNTDQDYQLSIHKKGYSVSLTEMHIGPLGALPDPEGDTMKITKLSSVDDGTSKVTLSEEVTSSVEVCVALLEAEGTVDESGQGRKDTSSDETFIFSHHVPIFDKQREVIFTVIAYEEETIIKKAIKDIHLIDLDSKVSWVGDQQGGNDTSLRAQTGSHDSIYIGGKLCLSKDSPCYFIEHRELNDQDDLEKCAESEPGLLQCNENITPFKNLSYAVISLHGSTLNVETPLSSPDSTLEVIIYDPNDPNPNRTIYSTGNITCTTNEPENVTIIECQQPLLIPTDRRNLRVLIVEVIPDGSVLRSTVNDLIIPPESGVNGWVIAGSVIGSLLLIVVVAFIVNRIGKKRKRRRRVIKIEDWFVPESGEHPEGEVNDAHNPSLENFNYESNGGSIETAEFNVASTGDRQDARVMNFISARGSKDAKDLNVMTTGNNKDAEDIGKISIIEGSRKESDTSQPEDEELVTQL